MSLPLFGFVCLHRRPLPDGVEHEAEWARRCAATARGTAHLWQGEAGFIVPRRYALLPGWAQRPAHLGLSVRASGGGLVPQGPGVWNLSLLWPAPSVTPTHTGEIYRDLASQLAAALARLGIGDVAPGAVEGSWCDGRYNLAVGGAKIAGTAQAWKRVQGTPVALVHAVIVVTADPADLTARANACEEALGNPTRYREAALTSVARCMRRDARHARLGDEQIEQRVLDVLAEQFARVVPPRVSETA